MTAVARFASSKDSEHVYEVSELEDGSLTCSCRGFTFRQSCLHVDAVVRWRGWHMNIPTDVLPPPVRWRTGEEG